MSNIFIYDEGLAKINSDLNIFLKFRSNHWSIKLENKWWKSSIIELKGLKLFKTGQDFNWKYKI